MIKFYGTVWCPESFRAKLILKKSKIDFEDIDIDSDAAAEAFVIEHNQGFRSVPTIVFPDGVILVEPSPTELRRKISEISTNTFA